MVQPLARTATPKSPTEIRIAARLGIAPSRVSSAMITSRPGRNSSLPGERGPSRSQPAQGSSNSMTDDAARHQWNQRFAAEDYVFGTAPNEFLVSQKHLLRRGGAALAVADGEGRNGVFLAEQGLDVLSVDFSDVAQDKARALAKSRGVSLRTEQ